MGLIVGVGTLGGLLFIVALALAIGLLAYCISHLKSRCDTERRAEKAADKGKYETAEQWVDAFQCALQKLKKGKPTPQSDSGEGEIQERIVSKQDQVLASVIMKITQFGLENENIKNNVRQSLGTLLNPDIAETTT